MSLDLPDPQKGGKAFEDLLGPKRGPRASEHGKWINVVGTLSQVPVSMVFWIVTDNELVQCAFGASWQTRLMAYRIGDSIKVLGKINESQVGDRLALVDCELR